MPRRRVVAWQIPHEAKVGLARVTRMAQRAVFLDRDNTIIADSGYIDDPDLVRLMPGAAIGIRALNDAGYLVVVVTNQSGIARGLLTEERLAEVNARMYEVLHEQGARIDALYYCPYLDGPAAVVDAFRRDSDWRKPAPGMLLQAATEHDIDLVASWAVGDSARDVMAGRGAGCRTIWLRGAVEQVHPDDAAPEIVADFEVPDLHEAAETILQHSEPPRAVVASVPDQVPVDAPPPAAEMSDDDVEPDMNSETEDPQATPAPAAPPPPAAQHAAEDTAAPPDVADTAVTARLLTEIRDLLRRQVRDRQQEDFSIVWLIATVTQILALAATAWALWGLFGGATAGVATTDRCLVAIVLQLITLTAFVASRRSGR